MLDRRRPEGASYWLDGCFSPAVECPRLTRALIDVVQRLSDEHFDQLDALDLRIVHAAASTHEVWPIVVPCDGARATPGHVRVHTMDLHVVILRSDIEDQPYAAVVGEIAHELGHVFLGHESGGLDDEGEFEACVWAVRAGFKEEVLALLRYMKDGNAPDEPRWSSCLARYDELAAIEPSCPS